MAEGTTAGIALNAQYVQKDNLQQALPSFY